MMPMPGGGGAAAAAGSRHPLSGEAAAAPRDDEQQEEEGEEDLRDGGVPFFVNRGGLPVDEPTWERMWRHVGRIHPEGERVAQRIRGAADLPKVRPPARLMRAGPSPAGLTKGREETVASRWEGSLACSLGSRARPTRERFLGKKAPGDALAGSKATLQLGVCDGAWGLCPALACL